MPKDQIEFIKKRLTDEIEKLILQGTVYFIAGGALGFDTLAAMTVLKLRQRYPQIKLLLALPCEEQEKWWYKQDIQRYEWIKSQADAVKVLSPYYYRGCMYARNRYMIDHSSYCICYLQKSTGGTAYTVRYAKKAGVPVILI